MLVLDVAVTMRGSKLIVGIIDADDCSISYDKFVIKVIVRLLELGN